MSHDSWVASLGSKLDDLRVGHNIYSVVRFLDDDRVIDEVGECRQHERVAPVEEAGETELVGAVAESKLRVEVAGECVMRVVELRCVS